MRSLLKIREIMNIGSECVSWKSGDMVSDQFPVGLRVLVVDDDPICLKILEKMLKNCHYEVTKCNSAEVALSILRENKNGFDIVIIDVHMPDMDGFKLLEHIRLEMDLPVIMVSADDSEDMVMKGVTHGAYDYLIKPVRIDALKNIWQHVVRKKKHQWKDNSLEASEDVDYWRNSKKRKEEETTFLPNFTLKPISEKLQESMTKFQETKCKMTKVVTFFTLIILATLISFLFLGSPPKSYYHSLFISDSFSDNSSIANHLYTLTKRPHVAGSQANANAAAYVLSILTSSNIPSHVTSYDVALTYPVSRSLTLTPSTSEKTIKFGLFQEIYDGDPYAEVAHEVLPTSHAYARSGTATGPVVYANYRRVEDSETLREMGVNVSNTVVLARYGKIYRGDIVHNAYAAGAIGVLIFTDKKDYGGEKWFPEDKWMPPSGVQVGSVYDGIGDPTTPGWPSTGECERLSDEEVDEGGNVPLIPSLPISWADGAAIIRTMVEKQHTWIGKEEKIVLFIELGQDLRL